MRSLLALLLASSLCAADPAALMLEGDEACNAGLWDVGALRYEQILTDPKLPKTLKPGLAIRLAEAWLRSGQPEKTLALLKETYLKPLPETWFWKAQALAATGRLAEACETLAPAIDQPAAAFRAEALLTRASLQLALGQSTEALLSLKPLAIGDDPAAAALARLRQAAIFLDQRDPDAANAVLPASADLTPRHRPEADLVRAGIALATGKPGDAIPLFAGLLEKPEHLSLNHYHAAAIGLAESLAAQDSSTPAATSLLEFISENPESPLLDVMFGHIRRWLPDQPKPDDPVLARLAEWIPPLPPPAPAILNAGIDSVAAVWPAVSTGTDLAAHAIYLRAVALQRIETGASQEEARMLLTRLRLEYPGHPLTRRARLDAARRFLTDRQPLKARAVLDHMQPGDLEEGQAGFLSALAAYQEGDFQRAVALFDSAAKALDRQQAAAARLNAAIIRLQQGIALPVTTGAPAEPAAASAADLQLEKALAVKEPAAAKAALDEFLTNHPGHPRQAEARLAAAEAALAVQPPDLAAARAQLETIESLESSSADPLPPGRLALVKLRLTDLGADPKATTAAAKSFLEIFPTDPAAQEVALVLGRSLYQAGDYNQARMALEKLAKADPDSPRAQAAWLLAARSAALVPSPQSREEALNLFDKAISIKAPLAAAATLEKVRLMLDLNHPVEAASALRPWIAGLAKDDPLHLPAGLLLGEAVTLADDDSPAASAEALSIYQKLLSHPATDAASRHRLKFLSGQMLEQLPDPKRPGARRIPEAIEAYYSVLEAAAKTPPAEWEWFERCGFRALELYAEAERWQAAIAIAKKIASFNGPRAADAANQARILQLKHMVWED
jgi:tetratricopeptide (TPR) repeat protein